MHAFHAAIHALPPGAIEQQPADIAGVTCTALAIRPDTLSTPFALSFEQAAAALSREPRLFVEPDGSLVWTGANPATWRVDGALYDLNGRLLYVEIKGACPAAALDHLLNGLGFPSQPLVFQLVRQGVFLGAGEFRRVTAALWQLQQQQQ